ncbi:asparagine-rich antigen [Reticulomyxa filosa]|uniref:Asparagine-rich antigen n=1 Tax=Reticulomyxa filosa TaxID=46433 RepID=X6NWP7_RETFI|nr:asparagine-rich antigen [Reticulomyxa filosa]|eukprot:ETO30259.1 asparagine-rich antigen [Reticulomyxa filosa]
MTLFEVCTLIWWLLYTLERIPMVISKSNCTNGNETRATKEMKEYLEGATMIIMDSNWTSRCDICIEDEKYFECEEIIGEIKEITKIRIEGTISKRLRGYLSWEKIKNNKKLKEIKIKNNILENGISNKINETLLNKNWIYLDLSNNGFKEQLNIEYLPKSLQYLNLSNNEYSLYNISLLFNNIYFPNLTIIDLQSNNIYYDNKTLIIDNNNNKLKYISLSNNWLFNDIILKDITNYLEYVDISYNYIKDITIINDNNNNNNNNNNNLTYLDLSYNQLNCSKIITIMEQLKQFDKLKNIKMNKMCINYDNNDNDTNIILPSSLINLNINQNNLNGKIILTISKNLTYIDLSYNKIKELNIDINNNNNNNNNISLLKEINLQNNNINKTNIFKIINNLNNLEILNLYNNKINEKINWTLIPISLKELYLDSNKINDINDIYNDNLLLLNLQYLSLSNNPLLNNQLNLTKILQNIPKLEGLFLSSTGLKGLELLLSSSSSSSLLSLLDISNNDISNEINFNNFPLSLTYINLYNNKLNGKLDIESLFNWLIKANENDKKNMKQQQRYLKISKNTFSGVIWPTNETLINFGKINNRPITLIEIDDNLYCNINLNNNNNNNNNNMIQILH